MEFFYPWTASVYKLLRDFASRSILLKSSKAPSISLKTAVREQQLSSLVRTTHKSPIFYTEILTVQD